MSDRILVVEDDNSLRDVLSSVLESEGFAIEAVQDAEQALSMLKAGSFAAVLSDFKLPGQNGIELLAALRAISQHTPFLLMTAFASIDIAVEAMKRGANDFITKPFEPGRLCDMMRQLLKHRRLLDRSSGLRSRRARVFLTQDSEVEKLLHQARKVAAVDTSCLLLGESGTGKELLARYIHEHSSRRDGPFIAINCAAIPRELLESEFFGHEAGAFTGATQARPGVLEVASEGTIFLDEVGDMPLSLQVKLLRALQEHEIKRVGSTKSIKVSPRVIAATNHDITATLEDGRMREDFYYRIAVVTLTIPPLRHRKGDIDLLINYYLEYYNSSLGKNLSLSEKAAKLLRSYRWPGNARELENVLERAAILSEKEIIPENLGLPVGIDFTIFDEIEQTLPEIAEVAVRRAEIEAIRAILAKTNGNKSKAAQLLGVSYKTLLNKVRDYDLEPTKQNSQLDA